MSWPVQLATCEKMGVRYLFLSPRHTGVDKEIACERLRRAGDIARTPRRGHRRSRPIPTWAPTATSTSRR